MRTVRIKDREYPIYTKDEAVERKLNIKRWQDGTTGDWIETDDGFVMECIKDGVAGVVKRKWVRTAIGTYVVAKSVRCTTEPREDRFHFNGKRTYPRRLTQRAKMFCRFWVATGNAIESYKKAYTNAHSDTYIEQRCGQLVNTPSVMSEVDRRVREAAQRHGIDEEWVIQKLKLLADIGEKDADKLRAVEDLIRLLRYDGGDRSKITMKRSYEVDQSRGGGFTLEELERLRGAVPVVIEEQVTRE